MASNGLIWPKMAFCGIFYIDLSCLISPYRTLSGHNQFSNGLKWPNMAKNDLLWHFLALTYLALSVLIGLYLAIIKSQMAKNGLKWPFLALSGLALSCPTGPYRSLSG